MRKEAQKLSLLSIVHVAFIGFVTWEKRTKYPMLDVRFFKTAYRLLKPGGFLVWGNAIPESTWKPCFDLLESIGMKTLEVCDVTKEAVKARDDDKRRIDSYTDQIISTFHGFKIPMLGGKRRALAEVALKNFARNPGTKLYDNMVDGTDTYKVSLLQKPLTAKA